MVKTYSEERERSELICFLEDSNQKREVCTRAKQVSRMEGYRYFKMLYSKLLNFSRLLTNSKVYFKEFCNREDFILVIMESLNFDEAYISCQAAQFLSSIIMLKGGNNSKLEKINKQKILDPKLDLVSHLKEFFENCDTVV